MAVKAGIVPTVKEYEFSSYGEYRYEEHLDLKKIEIDKVMKMRNENNRYSMLPLRQMGATRP